MRALICLSFCAALLACGDAGLDYEGAEALPLRSYDDLPACAREPIPAALDGSTGEWSDPFERVRDAQQLVMEFQANASISWSQKLARLVRDAPWQDEWRIETEDQLIEGKVVVRGPDWAVLEFAITLPGVGGDEVLQARLTVSADHSLYEIGAQPVEVGSQSVVVGGYARGCVTSTGLRYRIISGLEWPKGLIPRASCWTHELDATGDRQLKLLDEDSCWREIAEHL